MRVALRRAFSILIFLTVKLHGQDAAAYISKWTQDGDIGTVTLVVRAIRTPPVTGSPYYGVLSSSGRDKTLPDGTHHLSTTPPISLKMWRDSEGRMRTEQVVAVDRGSFAVTDINDPLTGIAYVLDDGSKVIHRVTLLPPPGRKASPAKERSEPRRQRTFEQIGHATIEGLVVSGTRMTEVIPVGEAGNDRPITSVADFWYSGDLQMRILEEYFDPRFGKGVNRITNISRAEPDAALFRPPDDYAVLDEKESFTMTVRRR